MTINRLAGVVLVLTAAVSAALGLSLSNTYDLRRLHKAEKPVAVEPLTQTTYPKCACTDAGLLVTGSCAASPMDVEECDRKRTSTFIAPWATSPKSRVCVKGKCMTLEYIEQNGSTP